MFTPLLPGDGPNLEFRYGCENSDTSFDWNDGGNWRKDSTAADRPACDSDTAVFPPVSSSAGPGRFEFVLLTYITTQQDNAYCVTATSRVNVLSINYKGQIIDSVASLPPNVVRLEE